MATAVHPGTVTPELKEKEIEIVTPEAPFVEKARIAETRERLGTGWKPDPPDLRDYTIDHPAIMDMLEKAKVLKFAKAGTPMPKTVTKVDLRQYCSPVENQGNLTWVLARPMPPWGLSNITKIEPSANSRMARAFSFIKPLANSWAGPATPAPTFAT